MKKDPDFTAMETRMEYRLWWIAFWLFVIALQQFLTRLEV